jgi:hypothetical protein
MDNMENWEDNVKKIVDSQREILKMTQEDLAEQRELLAEQREVEAEQCEVLMAVEHLVEAIKVETRALALLVDVLEVERTVITPIRKTK